MKTKKVLVFLLAIVLAFSFIGCNNKPKFTVTVTNGTGGGEYTQDTDCTVIADAVTGKAFVKWTVDDVSVSTDASYTFKVTEDVTVVAVFEFVDYTISVTGGTADKAAANYGQTVTLTPGAADTGKEFDYFTLNGTKITGDTFAMPAGNATVVAVYKFIAYTISVTGGSADKATGNYGETVTLTPGAPETGKEFDYWTVNDAKITGNTFAMPAANVTVVGTFKTAIYNITVTGGTADKATASYGETVTLTPGAAPAGKEFDYWTVNAGKITGSTFVIAAHSTVAAVYKDIPYNITVTGGTAKSTGVYGETITLTPTVSPFTFWNVNGIQIAGNTFVMPAKDTVVTANKLTTPYSDSGDGNSEKDKILVRFSDPYLEFDRGTGPSLIAPTQLDYVLLHIYGSDVSDSVLGTLKLTETGITTLDGNNTIELLGMPGNGFINPGNVPDFWRLVKIALSINYNEADTYYFAAQRIAKTDFVDSDISAARFPLCEKPGTPVESFDFEVLNGTVDGTAQTSGTAGKGALLVLRHGDVQDKVFTGWYYFTGIAGTETKGSLIALSDVLEIAVTTNLKIMAFFDDTALPLIPLATLANGANQVFKWDGEGVLIEMFRWNDGTAYASGSSFAAGIDYLKVYIYESTAANTETDSVGSFKYISGSDRPVTSLDGTLTVRNAAGAAGLDNCTLYGNSGDTDHIDLAAVIAAAIGGGYSSTKNYYFAVQSIAQASSGYSDSGISVIGTVAWHAPV